MGIFIIILSTKEFAALSKSAIETFNPVCPLKLFDKESIKESLERLAKKYQIPINLKL